MRNPDPAAARDGTTPRRRWTVVIVDEERRLDPRLRELLVHALPAAAEHLASRRAAVDAATDSRGD